MSDLAQVLADAREDAAVLRRHGQANVAEAVVALCERVQGAAEEYLTWLSEGEAAIMSGHEPRWFRARFRSWERRGHAKTEKGRRYYRQVVIEAKARVAQAREAGDAAARERSA